MEEFILAMGIPSALMGIMIWWLKRYIDRRDRAAEDRERDLEKLMLMIMQTGRANNILAEATARAVQRIPDAHCNGDMKAALELAAKIQKEEQEFLINKGVKHIFGDY